MKQTTINLPKVIYRTDQPKKDGSNSFYLQIHFNGKKLALSLYVSCRPEHYDIKHNRVKKSHPLSEMLNDTIDKLYTKACGLILEARTTSEPVSIKWFKDRFFDKPVDHKGSDFYSFAELEISLQKKRTNLAPDTIKKNCEQLNKLKRFAPKLEFNDITELFLANYEEYMREKLGNALGGSSNSLKYIRKTLYLAIKKKHTTNNPFKNFKIKEPKSDKIKALTNDELKALTIYFDTLNKKHKHYLALKSFLFSCYTGLRFGDNAKFKLAHINADNCIEVQTEKTKKTVYVPLMEQAKALINYELDINLPNLDTPCSQTCNRALKEIATICKINKPITTHYARHTFGTTAVNNGLTMDLVAEIMGHTSTKQTKEYAKFNHHTKIREMAKLESALQNSIVITTTVQQQ